MENSSTALPIFISNRFRFYNLLVTAYLLFGSLHSSTKRIKIFHALYMRTVTLLTWAALCHLFQEWWVISRLNISHLITQDMVLQEIQMLDRILLTKILKLYLHGQIDHCKMLSFGGLVWELVLWSLTQLIIELRP